MALHDVDAPLAHSDDRKGSMANIHAAIYRKAARQRENSDVNALVSDFGFLYECTVPCCMKTSSKISPPFRSDGPTDTWLFSGRSTQLRRTLSPRLAT